MTMYYAADDANHLGEAFGLGEDLGNRFARRQRGMRRLIGIVGLSVVAAAPLVPCHFASAEEVQAPEPVNAGLAALETTRARPLFSPTRQRPSPALRVAPAAPTVPPPLPPALQLTGVVLGADKTVAIVRRAADPRVLSLVVGQAVDGWTVVAIRPREVDIRQGARAAVLRLH